MRYFTLAITAAVSVIGAAMSLPALAGDMSRFVGKYPWEKVDGQSFFEAIQPDFIATFGKDRWRVFASYKTSPPMRHQTSAALGDLLDVSICMPHSCDVADARILVEEKSGRIVQLCFETYARGPASGTDTERVSHDVQWMGVSASNSRWFFHFSTPALSEGGIEESRERKSKNAAISCGDGWEKIMRDLASAN